jgi:uracil-DNA glycosylase
LPCPPRPILQVDARARILIAGQAPGRKAHDKGVPFDDPSGDRLRDWMGIDRTVFYDPSALAIVPMGLCFPGTGPTGDLPPRSECAPLWRERLLAQLPNIELTLVLGQYAQVWHFAGQPQRSVTETVIEWREHWPRMVALPHPSPRNNRWLKSNPWFLAEVVPALRARVGHLLGVA